jgi:hypothetical protein
MLVIVEESELAARAQAHRSGDSLAIILKAFARSRTGWQE